MPNKKSQLAKNYIVTTAVIGQNPHAKFIEAVKAYAGKIGAQILVPTLSSTNTDATTIHDDLMNDPALEVVGGNMELHPKLHIINFYLKSEQQNPLTGLARIIRNQTGPVSAIIPSSKQFFKSVADMTNPARGLWTTGACTEADYKNNRIGGLAAYDHTIGGVIVEAGSDGYYHARQFRWSDTLNCFTDLGTQVTVTKRGVKFINVRAEAYIPGDWHAGDTDEAARASVFRLMKLYRPKITAIHDLFNGHSVNHHERNKAIMQAQTYLDGRSNLEKEIELVAKDTQAFDDAAPSDGQVLIVESNHCEWLSQYLNAGHFIYDKDHTSICLAAANAMLNYGEHPLEFLIKNKVSPRKAGENRPVLTPRTNLKRTKFLPRDCQVRTVNNWELSQHGDIGVNGAYASNIALNDMGRAIVGHRHTPEIFRGVVVVGTNTKLRLNYNRGTSTWMHADAVVWPDGHVQLLVKLGQRDCKWSYMQE